METFPSRMFGSKASHGAGQLGINLFLLVLFVLIGFAVHACHIVILI